MYLRVWMSKCLYIEIHSEQHVNNHLNLTVVVAAVKMIFFFLKKKGGLGVATEDATECSVSEAQKPLDLKSPSKGISISAEMVMVRKSQGSQDQEGKHSKVRDELRQRSYNWIQLRD